MEETVKCCRNGHRLVSENLYFYNGIQFCRACRKAASAAYEKTRHREYSLYDNRRRHLSRYSLTPEQYEELEKAQKGLCAICGRPETALDLKGRIHKLSVDHDHETQEVRGLLCRACNKALGFLKDSLLLCKAMVGYLENPPAKEVLGFNVGQQTNN